MLRTGMREKSPAEFCFIVQIWLRHLVVLVLAALLYGPTTVYAQPPTSSQFYAYCGKPAGYYPYVKTCEVPWRQVPVDASKGPIELSPNEQPPRADAPAMGEAAAPTTIIPHENSAPSMEPPQGGGVTRETPVKPGTNRPTSAPSGSTKPASQQKAMVPPSSTLSTSRNSSPPADTVIPVLFFLLTLAPVFVTSRKKSGEDPHEAFTKALRRRASRGTYAAVVVGISFVLLISAPGGGNFLIAGIASGAVVMMLYGRGRIDQGNFKETSDFFEALQHFGGLTGLQHFNHREGVTCHTTTSFNGMKAPHKMLVISSTSRTLWLTPVRYWLTIGNNCSMGETRSISASTFFYKEKTSSPRKGDTIYGETWQHATKSGDCDHRYKNNYQVYEVERYGLDIHFRDNLNWQIGGMQKPTSDATFTAFNILLGRMAKHSQRDTGGQKTHNNRDEGARRREEPPPPPPPKTPTKKPWYVILNVEKNASRVQVVAARNTLVRQYHPDRIKGVEGLGPEFEKLANDKLVEINAAYEEAISSLTKA